MKQFLDRRPWLLTVAVFVVLGVILTVLGFTAPDQPHTPATPAAITSTPDSPSPMGRS